MITAQALSLFIFTSEDSQDVNQAESLTVFPFYVFCVNEVVLFELV